MTAWMTQDGVQPASRRGQIAAALREAIVRGNIPPGAQLKQEELSAYFNSSPAPVREALWQLESEGLVDHYLNRGAFVSAVSTEELLEVLLPVRLIVERKAFGYTAAHLTDDLIRSLQAQITVMEQGARQDDLIVVNEADVRFHELAVTASGMRHTVQLWRSVLPRIRVQFYRLAPRHHTLRDIAGEHAELLRVLQSGDTELITAALQYHIVEHTSLLLDPIHEA